MAAGEAVASLYVSSRHEQVEGAVASLCEIKDSYRQRTVITTLDNLAPAGRRATWHVTPAAADQVASEMRIAITRGVSHGVEPSAVVTNWFSARHPEDGSEVPPST